MLSHLGSLGKVGTMEQEHTGTRSMYGGGGSWQETGGSLPKRARRVSELREPSALSCPPRSEAQVKHLGLQGPVWLQARPTPQRWQKLGPRDADGQWRPAVLQNLIPSPSSLQQPREASLGKNSSRFAERRK